MVKLFIYRRFYLYNKTMDVTKIEIKKLQKSYTNKKKESKVVLYQFDLKVYPGEFLVLLGESGCGKTSLLRVISGIEDYDFGDIYFDGVDALEIEQKDKNMSFVNQNYVLFPFKTVYENIDAPLSNLKWNKISRIKRIQELADLLDLNLILTRKPKELSGGQQQRVAIARSLAKDPDICLFDEPLSALDPIYHDEIIKLLLDVHKKTFATYIYSTHNQKEAFILGDRIAIIHNMKVEQIGNKNEILNYPSSPYICRFLNEIFILEIKGVIKNNNFIFENNGFTFKIPLNQLSQYFNFKNSEEVILFCKNDAFIIDENGFVFNVQKRNTNSVSISIQNSTFDIEVDEDFEENNIKLNFDFSNCTFFIEGENIRK